MSFKNQFGLIIFWRHNGFSKHFSTMIMYCYSITLSALSRFVLEQHRLKEEFMDWFLMKRNTF